MKLKKGDNVLVTIGKDKGRKGKVEQVNPNRNSVLVTGVNVYKRHLKKRDEQHPGGIVDFPRPLSVAKVALICPKCGKATRVGYLMTKGEKVRICKKCEQKI